MKKFAFLFCTVGFIAFCSAAVQALPVELNLDRAYDFEWQGKIEINSPVDIYVANNLNPERWKEWKIVVWTPVTEAPVTQILVDYTNDPLHLIPEIQVPVELAPYAPLTWEGVDYVGFYADTKLPQWAQFGTSPVGSGGPFPIGNPAWVSFHFDVGMDPIVYIKDACVPEPATLALLGLGAALLRRRTN
jgi:hypothetical protein